MLFDLLNCVFYLSWIYIFYVYIGYYALLVVFARMFRKEVIKSETFLPKITLIISAYNEEKVIRTKILNSIGLDYPKELLEILVVSDASTDRTDSIVNEFSGQVRLIRQLNRKGKTSGLNTAVPPAQGEIIVFSDANSIYEKDALKELAQNFADPSVGYVTGESRYRDADSSPAGQTEGLYWKYESRLKILESSIGSMVGADGAIYAIRKELYEPLQTEDINDFVNPLQIIAKRFRGIYEPKAICYEETAGDLKREFKRKRRIVNRSWHGLFRVKQVSNPFRYPLCAVEIISHKLLRWMAPFVLALVFITNAGLSFYGGFYRFAMAVQIVFYSLAVGGYWAKSQKSSAARILTLPFYFCMVNLASALGIIDNIRGRVYSIWEPPERLDIPEDQVAIEDPGFGRRLNILFLAPRIPCPPNKGDKIRSFNELKYLAERHNIYLGTSLDKKNDRQYVKILKAYCREIFCFHMFRHLRIIGNLTTSKPFSVANFYSCSLQRWVNDILDKRKIDAVICFCSSMAEYVFKSSAYNRGALNGVRLIMDYVDLDSDKWQQYSCYSAKILRPVYRLENQRLFAYEQRINNEFDASIFVSNREKLIFEKLYPQAGKISVIQNGIDFNYFSQKDKEPANQNPILLFTGFMSYFANEDGIQWFCETILPLIKREFPKAQLKIVGSNPTRNVLKLARIPGVIVTGFIPDIRPFYWSADVCVIPLRIARGLQNKILEAMATGNAVVATSNASEGIICNENIDILVADQPEKFASHVIDLLKNPAKKIRLGQNAVINVRRHYVWEDNLQELDNILHKEQLIKSGSALGHSAVNEAVKIQS
jgi:sugar transferase (PEP-CTERM/EpsH1 system associated)